MHYVLSPRSRRTLARFAGAKALLAFDFDGTLAPIVADPARARMRPATLVLLRRLAGLRTCLVLSGRSLTDLRPRLQGTGVRRLVGNHGAEPWEGARLLRKAVAQWEQVLAAELPDFPGLWIENKTFSLTVHYRGCLQKGEARAAVIKAAGSLRGVRSIEGKECLSIVSSRAPNKGTALKAQLARLKCARALYVGDDQTDEDVFALAGKNAVLFAIRVGRTTRSHAQYYLRGQDEIEELLRFLLHLSPPV